jgi:hypothetical protein
MGLQIIPATSGARQAVRDECNLLTKLMRFLDEYGEQVEFVDDPSGSKDGLELTITNFNAGGGGAWSGPRSVTVHDSRSTTASRAPRSLRVDIQAGHVFGLQGHMLDRRALLEGHRQGYRAARSPEGLVARDAAMAAIVALGRRVDDLARDLAPVPRLMLSDGARFMSGQ